MKKILFIDFESYYDTAKAVGYDLKKLSILQYVRDARFKSFGAGVCGEQGRPVWINHEALPEYFKSIEEVFGWENVAVVGHNIKFDAFILREIYGVTAGQYIDTKGMSKAVLAKTIKGHSLKLLAEHFHLESKGIMETNGLRDLTPEQEVALATYCIHDVELCRDIYNRLKLEFPESQYEALHRTVDMFVNPKLELNVALLEETSKMEAERRANIFKEIGIEKSVFSSNDKFPALLISEGYEVPKKPSPKRKDENGDPVEIPALALGDPEFLEMLEGANGRLQDLCEARVAAKSTLLQTRSAKLAAIGRTGKWSFDVEFSGADQTHRFSGGSGAGGNPQNFTNPAKVRDPQKKKMAAALRASIVAPEGHLLVVGDFSQIEFRLVAYLSKDPGLITSIINGSDIYCDFASVFYGRQITKKDEKERGFGKQAILGLGYGMGAKKFMKTVRVQTGETISLEDAQKAIDLYRTRYSWVPALWDRLNSLIPHIAAGTFTPSLWGMPGRYGKCFVQLPSGLKLRYPNLRQERGDKNRLEWVYDTYKKGRLERSKLYGGKLLENLCQSYAGELCKEAMLEMGDGVTGLVHDEVHVLTKKGLELVTAQKLKRVMSVSPAWFPAIVLDAEVGVGENWGSAK